MERAEEKNLFRAIMNTGDGRYITDADFNITFVNNVFNSIYGFSENEAHAKPFFETVFMAGDDAEQIREYLSECSEWRGRIPSVRKNGVEFPVALSIGKLFGDDGAVEAYAGKVEDISEIVKAEEEISHSKRFLKFALDSLQTQVIILDENGTILHFNEAFKKFGREFKDRARSWTGMNYLDIMDEEAAEGSESSAAAADGIREVIHANREFFNMEYFFEVADEKIWFSMTVTRFKEHIPPRFVVSFDNITERKNAGAEMVRAKLEAESANRAKSRFLASMSHEIRTPMNAVLGYAQHLLNEKSLSKKQHEYVEIISRSGNHLLDLINEILDMSKVEAGRMTLNTEDTDFYAIMNDVKNMFKDRVFEKNLYLDFSIDESVPQYLYADGKKIRQIIINIVGNALKFTNEGGVRVRAGKLSDEIHGSRSVIFVEVEDTGCGISKDEVDKVFEVFGQASFGSAAGGGTGLGMPISLGYAKLMDGGITVESEPGRGSKFTFTFRAELLSSQISKSRSPDTRRVTGIKSDRPAPKILIVDDVASNRSVLRVLLENSGFSVVEASDGQDALSAISESMPDAVFMDRYMPSLDGIEAARIIKMSDACRNLPIMMLSASSLEENRREAIEAGIDVFLRKPFVEEEIFACLKSALGIDYIYEETVTGPAVSLDEVIFAEIDSLPAQTWADIAAAADMCDVTRLREIIDGKLAESCPGLASKIDELLGRYEYSKILALIKGGGSRNE
jgi:two-component system sensor histidine kinase/response regulator